NQAANLKTLMANAGPQGFILNISGTAQTGDSFLIRPTRSAARDVKLQLSDVNNIAAAMPIRTVAKATNAGQGTISVGSVTSSTIGISSKVKLTFDATVNAPNGALYGFPVGAKVTVGTTVYSVSSASQRIPFAAGATISFQGANFQIANTPANGDSFVVGPDMVTTGNSANPMVKADYLPGNAAAGNTLTYDGVTKTLSGFPTGAKVTLTDFATPPNTLATITVVNGTTQVPQPPLTLPTTGVSVNYSGVSVRISGQLANGQQITPGGFLVQTPQSLPVADIPLTFKQATSSLPARITGFPVGTTVTVTQVDGTIKAYPMDPTVVGADYVPYTPGATISFNGLNFQMGGTPADGDQFTISRNASGAGDNRNLLSLNALQTAHTMLGGSASYQASYAQLVSGIGNKARELTVTQTAQENLVTQTETSIQSISGVNLDEEAANLLRYQQAYQASAKVIDISQKLFDMLANLG
ncbi:MAG TPA: flagellar basal body rod C-terminal domain-containing protein, partial [Rhodocyclaceae bacterium]